MTKTIQVTIDIKFEYDGTERTVNTGGYIDAVAKDLVIRPTSEKSEGVRILNVFESGTDNEWWVGEF